MEKYLVDTTVLIDHLRNKPEATCFLEKEGLLISAVTAAELLQGARNKKEQKEIEALVKQFDISWISSSVSQLAIKLLSKHFLKFNLLFLDALIAATALEKKVVLVTDNIKHFKFISKLKVISPKEIETN